MLPSEQSPPSNATDGLAVRAWTALKMWLIVMVCLIMASFMIAVVVRDSVRKDVSGQLNGLRKDLEFIHEQNKRSIDDRTHLNDELDNTRASLKRLEEAVKKEVMKP